MENTEDSLSLIRKPEFVINHPDYGGLVTIMFHGGSPVTLDNGTLETTYGAYFSSQLEDAQSYQDIREELNEDSGTKFVIRKALISLLNPKVYRGDNSEEYSTFTGRRIPSKELLDQGFDGEILVFKDGDFQVRVCASDQIAFLE